ncbi:spore germination protein KA [Amphibacillus marinus]|uniref:Spore germination protein KA n=1 Tax=Amphibacillus marinus TaxID=872970 RepID=A0A1H8PCF3_9BACI|nr:spore germination protein [Amphibacillus marinus]SEO39630.1 spore germination protein KA [Amphibacillus marinus]
MRKKKAQTQQKQTLSSDFVNNLDQLKNCFSYGVNNDFSIRLLQAKYNNKELALCYYASLVNSDKIEQSLISPLLEQEGASIFAIITAESVKKITLLEEVIENITSGKVVLLMQDEKVAFSIDVSNFQHRAVSQSEIESVVRGPKEAFTESIHVNISLIRKQVRNSQLITEVLKVGERSQQDIQLVYNKQIVNQELLDDIRQRINKIKVDNVPNLESLEQYIEERPYSIFPTIFYTERPDNASTYIDRGHVVLLMESSASCLILPVTFWTFFHNPEDRYARVAFGNFSRLIRYIALFFTLMISAIYVALANFHSEMIPPDLLLAITAARERVPFPLILEVIIMEVAFELIREAGIRIPSPLGPTIGIVGALILGQAAVEANIISPIIVIVSALSGLTSFAISDPSFNFTVRISRFIFIIAAGVFGMFSLMSALILWLMYVVSLKSFGVPYLAPLSPTFKSNRDVYFRRALKKERWRPAYLLPKDLQNMNKNK